MKKYKFNISITEKCNLRCPHCYTGNKDGSLTIEEVDTIVENLAEGLTRVKIEGGEVYSEPDLFYHTITQFNNRFPCAEIRVNSNAVSFYDNANTIMREADKLFSLGVKKLRISLDEFHKLGGANLEKVALIKPTLENANHPLKVDYMSLTQALAIGNAEDLSDEQKERRNCMNHPACLDNPYFFTDIKGDLYTCCWRLIPPLGNLLTSTLEDLYQQMGELQKILLIGKVKSLAKTSRDFKLLNEWGECMFCKEIFKKDEVGE